MVDPVYKGSSWNARCFAGLKAEASRAGLTVVTCESCGDILAQRDVHACVLCCSDERWAQQVIRTLDAHGIHCVLAGPQPNAFCGASGTTVDRNRLVQDMVRYFVRHGRRRLACLGMVPVDVNDTIRVAAFHSAMREAGLSSSDADVFPVTQGLDACIRHLLARAGDYDGVLCVNDQAAVRLLALAQRAGIRVPEDLFVSGSGNLLLGQLCRPTLTTTELDYDQMGRQTVRIWQYLERSPDTRAITVTIGHRLIVRGSTAFLPEAPLSADGAEREAPPPPPPDETGMALEGIETCLLHCDALDLRMLAGILRGGSLERIAAGLFISPSALNYRLHKIYDTVGVGSRRELQQALLSCLQDPDALCRLADTLGT